METNTYDPLTCMTCGDSPCLYDLLVSVARGDYPYLYDSMIYMAWGDSPSSSWWTKNVCLEAVPLALVNMCMTTLDCNSR